MLCTTDNALVAATLRELFGQKSSSSELLDLNFLYAKKWAPYKQEIAVMVICLAVIDCKVRRYPAVTAIQKNSIIWVVLAPARNVLDNMWAKCEEVARKVAASLGNSAPGVFRVELFVTSSGQVTLNKVAPRPHNTGHYTQDACTVSQFNHL